MARIAGCRAGGRGGFSGKGRQGWRQSLLGSGMENAGMQILGLNQGWQILCFPHFSLHFCV